MLTISDELASLSRADLPRLLQIIVGQARDLANAEFAAFGVVDPGGAAFSTWVFAGIAPAQVRALSGPPRPVGLLGAIVSEGKTLRLGDLREHPSFGGFPPHHPAMTSFLGVPVRHGGRVVGNLYLTNKRGAAEFSEDDAHVVEMLAHRAGTAMEIARLNELEAHERAGLELLAETTRALAGSLKVDEIFAAAEQIVALSIPAFADYCALLFTDGERILHTASAHRDPSCQPRLTRQMRAFRPGSADPGDVLAHALRTRTPVLLHDLTREAPPSPLRAPLPDLPTASFMAIPLAARDHAIGLIAFGYAESERRYASRDLALAESVAMRLALAIDNARLYEAAQAAIRSRDTMMAVVSHDLRSPLTAIGLASAMLLRSTPEGEQQPTRRRLDVIVRSAAQMERLIEDLLMVTTIEAGSLSIKQRPVEVAALVGDLIESLRPIAEDRSISLEPGVAPALPMALCDRERVLQVLTNLVGNSLKFTPPGGHVRVAAELCEGAVRFAVSDTGSGISAAQLPHVFDRYWKGESAGPPGVGLGLAIAQGINGAHQGKLWAESTEGQGTTFFFTLPAMG